MRIARRYLLECDHLARDRCVSGNIGCRNNHAVILHLHLLLRFEVAQIKVEQCACAKRGDQGE
ncbi:hypothetical protein SDC9_183105 [bioreactor metagenome]|uniref:Uncharacterized protein n=1 Tax=bioreactor metagenome TaxID=1076179 RepID=A0A645H9C7_9ZZZZ